MRVFCVDSHTPLDNTYNGANYEVSGSLDTFGIFIYDADTDSITNLYDLDDLRATEDIKTIRNKILSVI